MKEDSLSFPYRHVVTFEETNALGNVYYTRHVAWQGRCREIFIAQNAPGLIARMGVDVHFVTLRVSCEFYHELHAFDEIEVRMKLAHIRQHRIGLDFDYELLKNADRILVARGFQELGCMARNAHGLAPASPPEELVQALRPFQAGAE